MHIVFVHTPMATMPVPQRKQFWQSFDVRYHTAHPGLRHMKNNLWELPHWMHWLAGILIHHGYTSVEAIDFYTAECAMTGINKTMVADVLRSHEADVYLFSPMTPNLPFAYEIADVIKELYPNSVTVFGGVVATPLHKEVASSPSVNYVVYDRGEYALPALLHALETDVELIAQVGNLTYKAANGEVVTNARKYPYMPVHKIPFPKIDLFEPRVGEDIRYLRQVYALGCPYKCPFCTIQTIGRKASYFPVERVLSEIRAYRAYYGEHHNIYFGDETFTLHPGHTLELLAALKQEGNIFYDCQTRLNCLNDAQVLQALHESGCRWVEIGIETVNQESSNIFKQRTQLSKMENTLMRVRDAGLAACSFMVNGFPNQTLDDMKRSVDYICSLIDCGLLQASYLFGLVPYPGSDMYEHPENYGITLLHRNFKYYHEEMPPVFSSAYAQPDDIYDVFLQGVANLAEVMNRSSGFTPQIEEKDLSLYGTFWQDPHV